MGVLTKVILSRPAKQLNKTFTYEAPDQLGNIPIGCRVIVPLGHTMEEGVVVGYEQGSITDFTFKIKPIKEVLDVSPWFTTEMIETAHKLSEYYLCTLSEAFSLFTIEKRRLKTYDRPKDLWLSVDKLFSIHQFEPRKKKQRELAIYLQEKRKCSIPELKALGFSLPVIKQVIENPHVSTTEEYKETKSTFQKKEKHRDIPLSEDQKKCYLPIEEAIVNNDSKTFLLHGVTGSGKTQVYMKAAQSCIEKNRIAIVLVPEIILTNQIVTRFVETFGDEVVVFHSKLTINERYNNWERLRRKDSHIIIGARSAIFAPTDDIGLIILDEEHEGSYKQEDMVRYHARKVAEWRSNAHSAPLILGSATPSIVSYEKAQQGEYTLLELTHRIFNQPLPKVQIVDMKEELFYGNYSVFSSALFQLIKKVLEKKQQMIILLNRRGYSTFVMCRDCGEVIKCPHCDVSMVYHQADEQLRCHYCDHHEPIPKICPHCGSKKIKFFGTGTQKVEEALAKDFPRARIARLDQDIAAKKGRSELVLDEFRDGKYDILLGTQMVAKGHDFPNVTGVGILTADSVLHIPLYTAAERTFNLLTQTAGRAGRGGLPGNVVIQTYNPLHYAIIKSKDHDYKGFYSEERESRKVLGYPPFGELIHFIVQHKDADTALVTAQKIVDALNTNSNSENVQVYGPYDEGIKKVRDLHRLSIMVRGNNLDTIKKYIYTSWIFTQEGLLIDVDPI